MRNFLRVLRLSFNYRSRIIVALIASILVAITWTGNISIAYPVLQVLTNKQNMHVWVDDQIRDYETRANDPKKLERIDVLRDQQKKLNAPGAVDVDNVGRRTAKELSELESDLGRLNDKLHWHRLLKGNIIRHLPTDAFYTFVWIMAAVVIGIALKGIFEFVQESLVGAVVQRTLFDFRNSFFRAALHQDLRQLADAGTTELQSRITNDVEQVGTGLKMLYGRVMLEPFKMLMSLAGACIISWQLTVMFIVVVLVAVFTLSKVSRSMKKAAKKVLERMSEMFRVVRESFDGLRVVKAFTGESRERRRFRAASADYLKRTLRVINIDALVGPLLETIGVLAISLALIAGAYLVLTPSTHLFGLRMVDDPISPEALLTLYMLLVTIADPVRKLSSVYTKMQSGMVAADRLYALYDRIPAVQPNANGPILPKHVKSVMFENVSFSYVAGRVALCDVSLDVQAGETIALVGPNGCGKSTLLGLLARFYDPDTGTVSVDDLSLRTVNLRSLRKQIGIVSQDTVLFDDTIQANIAYGRPNSTLEEVEAAAKQAHAHEFIAAMPQGYATRTGDMTASQLSGGQKQRIALARAILRDPRLLILDEFTSQIDSESEAKIHEALRTFVKGRTTFLITHRLSTLDLASRIVVMEAGRIVGIGQHADLIQTCETYRRLYDTPTMNR